MSDIVIEDGLVLNFYAVWDLAEKDVFFDANGGYVDEVNRKVKFGKTVGNLPIPILSKHKFLGWYTAVEGGTKISAKTKVNGNVTYYAQWAYNGLSTVSVAVADGCEAMGKVSGGKTAKAGTKLTLKATANKGYVFSHWEGPLGDAMDPCSPSITYTVGNEDAQFTAHFIPLADDAAAISFNMNDEYAAGAPIVPVAVDVSGCTSLPTVKVTGLPAGLKFTAKDIYRKGSKTEIEYPANTIYGTPTKSGVYTIAATVTTAGKKTASATQTIVVRKYGEKVVKVECDVDAGKVTGSGVYAEGKKVTLKATANKGFVFAGWYDRDADDWFNDGYVDYRSPSFSFEMGSEDISIEAIFVTAEEDSDIALYVEGWEITADAADNNFVAEGTTILGLELESISVPKAAVSGLPAGMKFTDKALTVKATATEDAYGVPANSIYGTPTKPDIYTVTVKLTNTSVKKAIVKEFTIEVPNLTAANGYFAGTLGNGVGEKYSLSVGVSNIDDFLPDLTLATPTVKLAVSGLPAGLKYDAKTGKITGIATKPGDYTVTLTITDGKVKYVSTITIEVEALPDWVVGTFRGSVETYGWDWSDICSFEVKVAANGGVSAKLVEPNPAWGSVSLKTYGLRRNSENEYVFVIWNGDYENGEEGSIGEVYIYKASNGLGALYAEEIGIDEDEDEFEAYWNGYQDVYSLALSEIPRPLFKTDNKRYFNIDEDGGVVLTFGAKGAVSVSEPGVVWGTSQLLPVAYDADNGIVTASLWLMGFDEWEGVTFGAELILSIPVSKDGTAKASEIVVEDVVPGSNW